MDATSDPRSDELLVQAALDGDDMAFAALVARHRSKIFRTAARYESDPHELDDLCQEIFLLLHRKLARFDRRAPFEHWLARIATRRCIDHLRRSRRRREHITLHRDADPIPRHPDQRPRRSPGEARELLEFALARLSPENRAVITLLELEERSVHDIASILGWTQSKVKVRAMRARHALAKILAPECHDP